MTKINVLSEAVRNRIAAGEVLERPASAVKELVENALDAGARRIDVEIEGGGIDLVRIADDGCGIPPEELALAITRHATSKIKDVDDIFHIGTLGFRGEALPSIAAVSRFEMISRAAEAGEGHRLAVEGGEVQADEPAARAPGTTVVARDLFFNTPARRKFLKSAAAEVAAVTETIINLAIPHPEVAFRLLTGGRVALDLPAHGDVLSRLAALFDKELAKSLIPVEGGGEGVAVSGYISQPTDSRATGREIYVFLNRRWIKSPMLVQLLRQAYDNILPQRRFPVAFLFLSVDPDRVDVNVHPSKREVRFREERALAGAVAHALKRALGGEANLRLPAADLPAPGALVNGGQPGLQAAAVAHEPGAVYAQPSSVKGAVAGVSAAAAEATAASQGSGSAPAHYARPAAAGGMPRPAARFGGGLAAPVGGGAAGEATANHGRLLVEEAAKARKRYRVVGQAHERYVVAETPAGIAVIDQHALHERLIYDQLLEGSGHKAGQKLLVPAVVELNPAEMAVFISVKDELLKLGFEVDAFGERSVAVQSAPAALKASRVGSVLRDCLAELAAGNAPRGGWEEPLLKRLACQAAVKAGDHLPQAEIEALLERHAANPARLTCPHGRPALITLSREELERRFGRT